MRYACLLLLVAIPGCHPGREFTRPEPDALRLGETGQAAVISRYGRPLGQASLTRHGCAIDVVAYEWVDFWGGRRQLTFWFHDERLAGVLFLSALRGEQPEFDEVKVARVKEGTTTRQEVLALFGPPSGEYIHPMTGKKDERILSYVRVKMWIVWKGATVVLRRIREAVFTFGPDEVLREMEFWSEVPEEVPPGERERRP